MRSRIQYLMNFRDAVGATGRAMKERPKVADSRGKPYRIGLSGLDRRAILGRDGFALGACFQHAGGDLRGLQFALLGLRCKR